MSAKSKIRVGDEVMGIMGVDGGYVGRVIKISGKDVFYLDNDGKVRQTSEWNLTKQVPPPGRFPRRNPPFYAHNLYEKKTHGLNLKQMRRLYAMVSRGNQKAITYARNVLGIPFSESPTQVKAVVYHHVRDLAERRVRRNPGGYVIGYGPDPYSVYDVIAESKDGSRYIAFYMLTRSEAKKQAERLKRNLGEKTYIVHHPRDRKGNLLGHPSSLLKGTRYYNDFYKYVRKNPMEYDVLRDRFEVMGGPITDKMQSLLRKIYNMRDAGKSEAQLRPFIKEYQRLKGLVTPLRRNPASSDVTPVVFRTFRSGGEVIALFPYEPGTMDPGTMMSYQHIGQHGPADMGLTAVHTRPSTPDEIRPLKNELERIGYKLKILKRIPGDAVRVRAEKIRSMR